MRGERIIPGVSGVSYSRGFTLIEIMVVVVILSILAAMVVPKIMSRPDEARAVRVQQDIRAIEASLNLFRLDNFNYPTTEQGLESLAVKPNGLPSGAKWKGGGYIERIPKDPWGTPYRYLQPGAHGEYDLYSLGADGVAGGTGFGADTGNWTLE
ncbi:MAG: type II secretion system major pseudopilin GspG [Candidatus Sedimenticola sp. (ex Thyasira tokunagai)]